MTSPPGITPSRRRSLLRLYGLSEADYLELWKLQGGRCAACRRSFTVSRPAQVDHDHRTGLVRGLLCPRDNYRLLGTWGDDPEFYGRLGDYLRTPTATRLGGAPRRSPNAPPVDELAAEEIL